MTNVASLLKKSTGEIENDLFKIFYILKQNLKFLIFFAFTNI